MDAGPILDRLVDRGLIRSRRARVTPLTGGVSSEILLIEDGDRRLVLKRALAKLRVRDDWYADVSRNRSEREYLRYVGAFLPGAVPRVLHDDPEAGCFVMEYLGEGYTNWKALLLEGRAEVDHARTAGETLGAIHAHSWGDDAARRLFDTTTNFYQLRIEPYLVTTGARTPALKRHFDDEARRLGEVRLCLVHGDYSPKNILIGHGRLVILDCEVAWYGEPAFDVAFLLNHFMLKALLHHNRPDPLLALVPAAWEAYRARLEPPMLDGLESRVVRLLLMLLLARVDGKSPVEYLTDETKQIVRRFVGDVLPGGAMNLTDLATLWRSRLEALKA